MTESWRSIPGWTYYAISSEGRVYSWKSRKYIKTQPSRKMGVHLTVELKEHGKESLRSVAKLMLIAFGKTAPSNYDAIIPLFKDGVAAHVTLDNLTFKIVRNRRSIGFDSYQWHQGCTGA